MTDKKLPSPELLRKLLRYEPDTGKLFWLPRDREFFQTTNQFKTWNIRYADKEAFTAINCNSYFSGCLLGRGYLAHRVIWAMQVGEWPQSVLDHIDRNRLNNVWSNLRQATAYQNSVNKTSKVNSSSNYLGVSWHKDRQKWVAAIRSYGSNYLGIFSSEIEAAKAYDAAARRLHGEFASLNFPDATKAA
jgi:hypothetical protein